MNRVAHEPAFVLHRYDFSESSLVLEVFTRTFGRVALVAKGAKKPSSNFRPVLLPLQPLQVSYSGDGEVRTLKAAEWQGGHVMPTGQALLSGMYASELVMRLLARDDPHPKVFDAYAALCAVLSQCAANAATADTTEAAALRAFELLLLADAGLLPNLAQETATLSPLHADQRYTLKPELGLRLAVDDEPALPGAQWLALQAALTTSAHGAQTLAHLVSAVVPGLAMLRPCLRAWVQQHGGKGLRTRQVMLELRGLGAVLG